MTHLLLPIMAIWSFGLFAIHDPSELAVEFYLDSLMSANNIDYQTANSELLVYAKRNYKTFDNVKEFVDYSTHKMKCKQKEYTKNFTREYREFNKLGVVAHNNMHSFEQTVFKIISSTTASKYEALINQVYITLHEINYWELNCYKPMELGKTLTKFFNQSANLELVEKISLFVLAAKIYKASYYVNPMHICESNYARTKIMYDTDSLNLTTESITIDSLPSGTLPPTFIGGNQMLKTYIKNNIKYPEKAILMGHEGRVLVSFKVDESGQLFGAKIKDSPSEYLSKEALRLVDSLPQWKPDSKTQEGVGFTKFTLPFDFVLPEK
ncbi:MAG: TonB family protein [Putridiphycobacter sp.]|nr:TonB family protein [Putridiphycobacter sp.]